MFKALILNESDKVSLQKLGAWVMSVAAIVFAAAQLLQAQPGIDAKLASICGSIVAIGFALQQIGARNAISKLIGLKIDEPVTEASEKSTAE